MKWTSEAIRSAFIGFFEERGHSHILSAPIVVKDDPTLMFTNAGMNQFKGIFLGNTEISNKRAVNSQTCLRVSGKHNDLEEVGRDHYHHTMFEMLGNWSFGDYFKEDAIGWAWELLTKVYQIDKDIIYVSVFSGDEGLGLEADTEAEQIWAKYISKDRILRFSRKDNFWEMGDTGPCGPCSEIHVDLRSEKERKTLDAAQLVNTGHPEVIEIWNLVFIQFNRLDNGSLTPLRHKHVDTGMGLERLTRALQGVESNYEIDLFRAIVKETEQLTAQVYSRTDSLPDIAFRVIADHVRAVSFCIADGQLPSNNGAGYVIKRILRRAIRYGYSGLRMRDPFIYKLVDVLVNVMGEAYPNLKRQKELVSHVILEEERAFLLTLGKGIERIENYLEKHPGLDISGAFAFELYDTYGFPVDLTRLIAEERGVAVDLVGFEKELSLQKERSRGVVRMEVTDWVEVGEPKSTEFIGYDQLEAETHVVKYRNAVVKGKEIGQIVLAKTPFYAESGGQIGDQGTMVFEDGFTCDVLDTKRENNEVIHYVNQLPKEVIGRVVARVQAERRSSVMKNHSATHLLHHALRQVLGTHVEQKGSLVAGDRLRFDFSHFEKMKAEQIERVEHMVRAQVAQNIPLEEHRGMPIQKAKEMGAMALFGEKYGNEVRVIKFGASVELCGGTHVSSTKEIGGFRIVSEAAVAAGVRRIEAITGQEYQRWLDQQVDTLAQVSQLLGNPKDVITSITKLQSEQRDLQKQLAAQQSASVLLLSRLIEREWTNDRLTRIERVDGNELKILRDAALRIVTQVPSRAIVLLGIADDKVVIAVAFGKQLQEQFPDLDASSMLKAIFGLIDGGGGGQRFLATATGKNKEGLQGALQYLETIFNF